MAGPWNANIHYDGRLDACVPASATSVLDVGCGDGFLAARLARRVPLVVAIDVDAPVLDRARARFPEARVTPQPPRDTARRPHLPPAHGAIPDHLARARLASPSAGLAVRPWTRPAAANAGSQNRRRKLRYSVHTELTEKTLSHHTPPSRSRRLRRRGDKAVRRAGGLAPGEVVRRTGSP